MYLSLFGHINRVTKKSQLHTFGSVYGFNEKKKKEFQFFLFCLPNSIISSWCKSYENWSQEYLSKGCSFRSQADVLYILLFINLYSILVNLKIHK